MQPYLFPYLGYFQLVAAVDAFVFLDDAAFPKQGWVNRNRLRVGDRPWRFSLPLEAASCHRTIAATRVHPRHLPRWRRKLEATIRQSYPASPHKDRVLGLLEAALSAGTGSLGDVARRSVEACCAAAGLGARFLVASRDLPRRGGERGAARVLRICRDLGARTYVNAPGGRALYDPADFAAAGLGLRFLRPRLDPYPQARPGFVPGLSILDLLLNLEPAAVGAACRRGELDP